MSFVDFLLKIIIYGRKQFLAGKWVTRAAQITGGFRPVKWDIVPHVSGQDKMALSID
ncbi:MAG: hypothetical protein HOF32_14405 [Gammaproteobacteria bacterium]|nr:hypothetical protein [Gammaproteobacteria bacterium]MDC0892844.1 hypothetical protein [Pseudomonadales bacterium]MDC6450725.1 hypothetical protein [Pseudomonadales bacterium]